MSDYNNFNGYQQESQPTTPIVISPEGAPNYQNNYQQNPQQQVNTVTKFNAYGLVSILLAPLGCCCCALPAVVGLILGIIGLKKYNKNILCIVGIVLCALTILYWVWSFIYTLQHPEEYQQAMEMYMEMIEESMQQAEQTAGFIFRR